MPDDDLFAVPKARARTTDPETSHLAAAAIDPAVATIRAAVEKYARTIAGPRGFTDEELSEAFFGKDTSSYRTRRAELVVAGEIVDSGRRALNSRGRDCILWVHLDHAPAKPPAPPPIPKVNTDDLADCFRLMDACVYQMRQAGWMCARNAEEALKTIRKATRQERR